MKVLAPQPNNELFKIENVDAFTSKRLTKKHPLWDAFVKIKDTHFKYGKDETVSEAFWGFVWDGDFNKNDQTLYIYVGGDGSVSVTKSLETFSEGYRTEKQWGVKSWNQI